MARQLDTIFNLYPNEKDISSIKEIIDLQNKIIIDEIEINSIRKGLICKIRYCVYLRARTRLFVAVI